MPQGCPSLLSDSLSVEELDQLDRSIKKARNDGIISCNVRDEDGVLDVSPLEKEEGWPEGGNRKFSYRDMVLGKSGSIVVGDSSKGSDSWEKDYFEDVEGDYGEDDVQFLKESSGRSLGLHGEQRL